MIKVLQLGLSERFGGIESFLLNIRNNIDINTVKFDYVAYSCEVKYFNKFETNGSKIYYIKHRKNIILYYVELLNIMKQYDIIHINKNSAIDFIPFIAAKKAKKPIIIAHSHNAKNTSNIVINVLNALGRFVIINCSDYFLSCSRLASNWLFGSGRSVQKKRGEILYNGIDLNIYKFDLKKRMEFRRQLGVKNSIVVGCVGRFVDQKNQIFLLKILKLMLKHNKDVTFLFIGDGPNFDLVRRKFNLYNKNVIFMGAVDNVCDYLQAMDVFVMPSLYEGLPIAAIEAQANGLPVILSNSITDEVICNDNVVRCSLDAEEKWCEYILSLNRQDILSSKLKKYDIKLISKKITHIYMSLLKKKED